MFLAHALNRSCQSSSKLKHTQQYNAKSSYSSWESILQGYLINRFISYQL